MLPSTPRRRVSSLQADKEMTFTIGDANTARPARQHLSSSIWQRRGVVISLWISMLISVSLCLLDMFLLDDPLALLQIRLFAWFGIPILILICLTMAMVLVRICSACVSLMFGRESLLSRQMHKYKRHLIVGVSLVLAEMLICRFWLSAGLEHFIMREPEQIWSKAFDITSLRLQQAIEMCQIIYILLFCWVLLSVFVAFIKNMIMASILESDIAEIRLNQKILDTLCCETQYQRNRLFQNCGPLSDGLSKVDINDEIDSVRENPLRLPLTATASRNHVHKWVYSEKESVNVTSLAQMHVLSAKIRDNIFSGSPTLTYKQWEMLFIDEDMAHQAWTLMFSVVNLADASHVSEHRFALALVKTYMRHVLLEGKIRNFDAVFGIVKMVAAAAWCFAMVYVISIILGHNPTFMLVSLLAFFGSVTFAVSSSINYAVVCVIFILFKKPYQVGDRVNIDGDDYYVSEINLLSTTFSATDNRCLIMSNYSLSAMKIWNHQLSSPAVVKWVTTLHPNTTDDQLDQLREGLVLFAHRRGDFWKPQISFALKNLVDGSLKLTVKAHHRLNWQQSTTIADHKTMMIEEFRRLHLSMGIATGAPEGRYQILPATAA